MTRTAQIAARYIGWSALAAAAFLAVAPPAKADFSSATFKSVYVRTDANIRTIVENNLFTQVPGMSIGTFVVPEEDSDLFTVLYTAQSELRNGSTSDPTLNSDDVLELQLHAVKSTGAIIILSPSGPTAFASDNSPQAQALSWSGRLSTGIYTFKLMGRVRDVAPTATVTGILTSAMITITRYN